MFNFGKTYTVPLAIEEEDNGKNIITWGKDNLYPQWANYLFYHCAVHQGIIKGKVFYTISGGLKETPNNADLLKLVNPILHGIDLNLELGDCYYVKCRLSADKTKIEKVTHVPYEWVRVTQNGNFRVSQDWTDSTVEILDYFSQDNRRDEDLTFMYQYKVEPMQMLVELDSKKVTYNYYPTLPYSGAIKSILTDIEITNYTLSEVVNNFSLGTLLQLNNGEPKKLSDREDLEDRILETATGSDNAGGVFITFGDGKETEPTVVHLNGNQLHERYVTLSEDVRTNMLRGHSAQNGELFGFDKDGSFNADTLDWSYWIFKENYVKVRQNQLLAFVNFLSKFNGVNEVQEFNEVSLLGQNESTNVVGDRLNNMSPLLANSVISNLTVNEIRNIAGLTSIEGGDTVAKTATFSKQESSDKVISEFMKYGTPKDKVEFLASEPLSDEPFKSVFATLPSKQIQVLNLIIAGESFDSIHQSTKINPLELSGIYNRLRQGGHLDKDSKVTKSGKLAVVQSDISKMKIMYSYEVKPGYGAEVIAGTRDFCRDLIAVNRVYSREDINQIGSALGMNDIFRYRGGWYTVPKGKPNAGAHEPSCRHEWKQNIIFE